MAEYAIIKTSTLLEIADAIRAKREYNKKILPENMKIEILGIETGADVSGVTALSGDVLSGKAFVDSAGVLRDGTMPIISLPRPTLNIDDSTGTITAKVQQTSAGYVLKGIKSENRMVLPIQSEYTVTPSTNEQTVVTAGTYVTGDVKVEAMPTATQATPVLTIDETNNCVKATCTQDTGYVEGDTTTSTRDFTKVAENTYTPTASQKSLFSSGLYYFTGSQYIDGDSNLVPSNIKSGVSIFGVDGAANTYNMNLGAIKSTSEHSITFSFDSSVNIDDIISASGRCWISGSTDPKYLCFICNSGNWTGFDSDYNSGFEVSVNISDGKITISSEYMTPSSVTAGLLYYYYKN